MRKHAIPASLAAFVLLSAIVGRPGTPEPAPVSRRPAPAPVLYASHTPVHASTAWAGDSAEEAKPAPTSGHQARVLAYQAQGVNLAAFDANMSTVEFNAAMKASSKLGSENFYALAEQALSDDKVDPGVREYAIRLLIKKNDRGSRAVIAAWIHRGISNPEHRARAYGIVLRCGESSELASLKPLLVDEREMSVLTAARSALASNGSSAALELARYLETVHLFPAEEPPAVDE